MPLFRPLTFDIGIGRAKRAAQIQASPTVETEQKSKFRAMLYYVGPRNHIFPEFFRPSSIRICLSLDPCRIRYIHLTHLFYRTLSLSTLSRRHVLNLDKTTPRHDRPRARGFITRFKTSGGRALKVAGSDRKGGSNVYTECDRDLKKDRF